MSKGLVECSNCRKEFLRDNRYIHESLKLKLNSYCSAKCFSIAKNKQKNFVCENKNCKSIFKRSPNDISFHNFCSRSCAAIYRNTQKWGPPKPKIVLSKEERYALRIAASSLGGINHWKNYQSKYTKELIIQMTKEFVTRNSRLPVKREMTTGYKNARNLFGTWNNAITAAGFEPNPVLFAKRQIAKDGHICDSLAEKIIDDWFYVRNIVHKIHAKYPDSKYTADFVVNGITIEFFGLSGELNRYDELMKNKLKMIKERRLKFISIYPKDVFPASKLDQILGIFSRNSQS